LRWKEIDLTGRLHAYETELVWTGNTGVGTEDYRSYERGHVVNAPGGKPAILGSSDVVFRGDESRWNPEELLVASVSACHMLSFLHRAALAGVVVVEYSDSASGTMKETDDGGGTFAEVVLRPVVTVQSSDMASRCDDLHDEAHARCFIASSVTFPVRHEPTVRVAGNAEGVAVEREHVHLDGREGVLQRGT
jgi:organic hydroperoxide reductase OsmC/OhrA